MVERVASSCRDSAISIDSETQTAESGQSNNKPRLFRLRVTQRVRVHWSHLES